MCGDESFIYERCLLKYFAGEADIFGTCDLDTKFVSVMREQFPLKPLEVMGKW